MGMTPSFPNIQIMVDYINKHPEIEFGPVFFDDGNRNEIIACGIEDVILNGKPRRKFINLMNRVKASLK
jgi:hypothetical protein